MTLMMDTPVATRRVVYYARVSSEDQRERATIAMQLSALDARLAAEHGVSLVERYVDDGVSSRIPLARRPAGARLLRDAEARRFHEIWVFRLDRLGRKVAEVVTIADRLDELGIAIVTVTQGRLEPFILHIYAALAEEEMRTLRQRTSGGLEEAAKQGRYMGGIRSYGYRVEGDKGHARLVPDDEDEVCSGWTAAGVIRIMYERIALADWSCQQVADELNALGVPTSYARDGRGIRGTRTRGVWTRGRIGNMVKEPIYRGVQVFGRRSKRPRVLISAEVPALVPVELWDAAQETLARHVICAKNTRRMYLLRSVMRCSRCGLTYVGSHNKGTTWYRCGGQLKERRLGDDRCQGQSIKGASLEDIVWSDIERFLRDPGDLLRELDGHAERDAEIERQRADLEALRRRLVGLDDERREMVRQRSRGRLTDAELDEELARIDADRAELAKRLDTLSPTVPETPSPDVDLLDQLRGKLDAGLSPEQRQEIVRLLVGRISIVTAIGEEGTKEAKAIIGYLFPRVVKTHTVTGSWPR